MTELTRAHVHVIITLLDICIYSCSELMRFQLVMRFDRPWLHDASQKESCCGYLPTEFQILFIALTICGR